MATASDMLEENISSKKQCCSHSLNNHSVKVQSSKDLLRVCPERGIEKYLLKKTGKGSIPPKTFKPPPCQALRQVKDFLPAMKKAQRNLLNEDINMENVEEDEPYINMDVQLVELDESDSSTDSDSESDGDDSRSESENCTEDFNIGEVTTNNFVITKPNRPKKPLIEDIT